MVNILFWEGWYQSSKRIQIQRIRINELIEKI